MWERVDRADPRRPAVRVARALTLGATALFWLIATSWRPWRLFARAGFSADFYDEQARAFWRGRLHVDPDVAGVEGFLIGELTYLYYGPALAVARMPTALWGRWLDGRLALASMLVALVVLGTWSYRLMRTVARSMPGRTAGPWRTGLFVGAVLGSPVLFLAGWISVYHETELWACTFAVIAATCMLEVLGGTAPERRWILGASAATVATVLTRASVGLGVAIALVAVALWCRRRDRRSAVAMVAAAAGGVAVHMAINLAKFGSLLGLPAERQVLSLVDPERAAWFARNDGSFFSLDFLPTTVVQYFRPDTIRFERMVPGLRFGPLATDLGPTPVETITPASSLTVAAPVLLVLAAVGVVWWVRRRRWWSLAIVGGLVVGAVPSFTIGFVANRYLVDMLPALAVPAAAGLQAIAGRTGRPISPTLVRVGVVSVLVWGFWVNAALGTWALGLKSPGFHELRVRVDAALFSPPRPGIVVLTPGVPVPRDGVVAVEVDCAGVYVAEQGSWVALERAPSRRILEGTLATDRSGPVVAGNDWLLSVLDPGPDASVRLESSGIVVTESPIGRLGPGDRLLVVADPVTREFFVEGPTGLVFFDPGLVAPDGTVVALEVEPGGGGDSARLCRVLRERG